MNKMDEKIRQTKTFSVSLNSFLQDLKVAYTRFLSIDQNLEQQIKEFKRVRLLITD